jgi:hypothetical protein
VDLESASAARRKKRQPKNGALGIGKKQDYK